MKPEIKQIIYGLIIGFVVIQITAFVARNMFDNNRLLKQQKQQFELFQKLEQAQRDSLNVILAENKKQVLSLQNTIDSILIQSNKADIQILKQIEKIKTDVQQIRNYSSLPNSSILDRLRTN